MKRKFVVTRAEAGSWSTSFSIKDLGHNNPDNSMGPEAFFHHIGGLVGRSLEGIQGLEFEVVLKGRAQKKNFDPLSLCGKTIGGNRS